MGVLERQSIMQEIQKHDPEVILQRFLAAGRIDKDGMKQSAIQVAMVELLREGKAGPDFLSQLREHIENPGNSHLERGMLLGVLADAGTKEAVDVLLYEITHLPDVGLRETATRMIDLLRPKDPESVAPLISRVWVGSVDSRFLQSAAIAMGSMGSPRSIELLLSAASVPDGADDVRRSAALLGLSKVYRDEAVPLLSRALETNPIGSRVNTLAFKTLTQIADNALRPGEWPAAKALVGFIANADERAAPMAYDWIVRTSHESHVGLAKAALNPSISFRSEANRDALRRGLADYEKNRIIAPAGVPLR
jgi:HEAT repeat protein